MYVYKALYLAKLAQQRHVFMQVLGTYYFSYSIIRWRGGEQRILNKVLREVAALKPRDVLEWRIHNY